MKTVISQDFKKAAAILLEEGVVAIPTETVYGLAGLFFSEKARREIYRVKGRPQDNPLIVHIGEVEDIYSLIREAPDYLPKLLEAFFPGPLTLILKKAPSIPYELTGGLETIAIRMPKHPLARALLSYIGEPLVAPSANLSGKPSPTCVQDVLEDLDGKIPLILEGGSCSIGIESTVLNLTQARPQILRPGGVLQEELEEVLSMPIDQGGKEVLSPGMKYRHYAPNTPLTLFEEKDPLFPPDSPFWILSFEGELEGSRPFNQTNFYALLREADRQSISHIYLFVGPRLKQEAGLMNRIQKAAQI